MCRDPLMGHRIIAIFTQNMSYIALHYFTNIANKIFYFCNTYKKVVSLN